MKENNEIENKPKLTIEGNAVVQTPEPNEDTKVELKKGPTGKADAVREKAAIGKTAEEKAATGKIAEGKAAAEKAAAEETAEEESAPSLQEIIREQATEDEAPMSKTFTLRKILGGDILTTQVMRRQIWLFLLITLFVIIYISNRYSCQQHLIEIDKLQKELKDAKYKALSSSSQLTEKTRESRVLEMLQSNQDSILKIPNQPPYVIQVQE